MHFFVRYDLLIEIILETRTLFFLNMTKKFLFEMSIIHIFVMAITDCGKHFQSVVKTLILKEAFFSKIWRFEDFNSCK